MSIDRIEEVNKNIDTIEHVEKFNPYHGKDGRFSSASGGGATSTPAVGNAEKVEEIVRSGSYSPTTVARKLGIEEKEASKLIASAQKKVGEERGTTLGMKPGDSRVLNRKNMYDAEWDRALREAGNGSTIKTKSGATYTKNGSNWEGVDSSFYSGHKSRIITGLDGVKSKGIEEFKYIKRTW